MIFFLHFFLLQHFHILYIIHLKNILLNYKKKEDKAWNTVTYTDKKKNYRTNWTNKINNKEKKKEKKTIITITK